nr:GerAB/ArcD/ProY family transporter [Lachnospiraceae bacterium]
MILNNDKISARQLYRMIVISTVGITCLLSTDISIYFAGRDGLFCIIGALILSLLYAFVIIGLCRITKWNYDEYAKQHFHDVVNKIIYGIFLIRYFVMLILALAFLLRIIRSELLTEMGYIGTLIPILLLMAYSVSRGLEARARMTECMIYIVLIPIFILAVLGISGTDQYYLVPLFHGNIRGIIGGSIVLFLLFSPLEMLLFMSEHITCRYKTEQNKDLKASENPKGKSRGSGAEKAIIWGIITIFVLNIIFYVISVGNLSANVIAAKGDAVLNLAKSVKLPYLVFEKQGGMFMLFFVVSLFIAIFCLAHHTMFMAEKLMGKKSRISYAALILLSFIGLYVTVHYTDYFHGVTKVRETRVEIENREYADSMIINYAEGKYGIALTFPDSEDENRLEEYKVSAVHALKYEYGKMTDKRLDLSHVQVVILGEKILKDEKLFREVMSFLENEKEISDSLNVCAVKQNMETFTDNIKEYGIRPGRYISKMIENNIGYAKAQFKKISLVMYDTEQSCLLSLFSAKDGGISYEGNVIVTKSGYVAEYEGNAARITELVSGGEGMEIDLSKEKTVLIDKNDYYMRVEMIGSETIHVKLIYSGKISGYPNSEYSHNMEEEELIDIDMVNEVMETIIFDRIQSLTTEFNCDLLGIYKHLAIADKEQWNKYKDNRDKMLERVFVEVETRYE